MSNFDFPGSEIAFKTTAGCVAASISLSQELNLQYGQWNHFEVFVTEKKERRRRRRRTRYTRSPRGLEFGHQDGDARGGPGRLPTTRFPCSSHGATVQLHRPDGELYDVSRCERDGWL